MDLGRVTHRLGALATVGGLAAIQLGTQGAGPAMGTGGALLSGAIGMIGSVFADDFRRHLSKRVTDPKGALQNHDLNELIAETIALVLREFAQNRADRRVFEALASTARKQWPRICQYAGIARLSSDELAGALESDVTDLLAEHPRNPQDATALDRETWVKLLEFFAGRTKEAQRLRASTIKKAATHLASRFSWAFREKAKTDFENGGRAYAGLHLMALGELLASTRSTEAKVDTIAAALPGLQAGVVASISTVMNGMDDEARRRHGALLSQMVNLGTLVEAIAGDMASLKELLGEIAHAKGTTSNAIRDGVLAAIRELPVVTIPSPRTLLRLDSRERHDIEPNNLASRLLARNRAIPMIGRDAEIQSLVEWLVSEPLVSLRVIQGNAGIGKTRLGVELVERALDVGWHAGFADAEALRIFHNAGSINWEWDSPTLVVVDYASGRPIELEAMLRGLVEQSNSLGAQPSLRVLLLDRHSGEGMTWWNRVLQASAGRYGATVSSWYDQADIHLNELKQRHDRLALLRAAAETFGTDVSDEDLEPILDRLEAQRLTETPLLMQVAVIHHLQEGGKPDVARDELLEAYRQRDIREVIKGLELPPGEENLELFQRLVALATLLQGHELDIGFLKKAIKAEAEEIGCDPLPPGKMRHLLRDYLGSKDRKVQPLVPDLIAEHWIIKELERRARDGHVGPAPFLTIAVDAQAAACGDFLLRACQDFKRLIPLLSDAALDCTADRIPRNTVALRLVALEIERERVDRARNKVLEDESSGAARAELASRLNAFSFRLAGINLREEALTAIKEAIEHYRELALLRSHVFEPNLARNLKDLSNRLAALGHREDALAAIEESVRLYRSKTPTSPDVIKRDLAKSLSTLSNRLAELGRREEALAAIEEAVELRRRLSSADPDALAPYLSSSLNILSNRLGDLGRRDEALAAIEEAVEIRRGLAADRPDAFTPDLAKSLNNLSNHQAGLGRRKGALVAIEEAVELRRGLVAARPDAFTPDLATSLNDLSNRLAGLGRRVQALAAIEEAVGLRRRLAATHPDAFMPNLATSLNNLGGCLGDLGRCADALTAVEEAVELHRRLATARPESFAPNLASSLNNLSGRLWSLGRREEALAAAEEAVELYRVLVTHSDAFMPNLAASLSNLCIYLGDLDRNEEASTAIEEAVDLCRGLASKSPDAFTPDLATSLNNQSNSLARNGRHEEALAVAEEAVELYRELATAQPDAFTQSLATSLNNLSGRLEDLGRSEEAQAAVKEAYQRIRDDPA